MEYKISYTVISKSPPKKIDKVNGTLPDERCMDDMLQDIKKNLNSKERMLRHFYYIG